MYIGIDLGGTNIAVGFVDDDGYIICKDSTPVYAGRSYEAIVADMASLCKKLADENNIDLSTAKAAGIGSPGSIDSKAGKVIFSGNLFFNNAPLCEELNKHLNIPVFLENDANAAAYGEYFANGNGCDSFIAVTLGTGIGGGIILNKQIYRGFNGIAGEIGHMTLVHGGNLCSCGRLGCWETYASATALIRQTKIAMQKNPGSKMNEIAKKRGTVDGRTSFDAAKLGDEVALYVVDKYISYLADGIVNMINIFQPEVLVVGGGISKEGDYLLEPLTKYIRNSEFNSTDNRTQIKAASLFNDAGILGAALAAKSALGN